VITFKTIYNKYGVGKILLKTPRALVKVYLEIEQAGIWRPHLQLLQQNDWCYGEPGKLPEPSKE
jgi:hypothetical protein